MHVISNCGRTACATIGSWQLMPARHIIDDRSMHSVAFLLLHCTQPGSRADGLRLAVGMNWTSSTYRCVLVQKAWLLDCCCSAAHKNYVGLLPQGLAVLCSPCLALCMPLASGLFGGVVMTAAPDSCLLFSCRGPKSFVGAHCTKLNVHHLRWRFPSAAAVVSRLH